MKSLLYLIFSFNFHICRLFFKVKEQKVFLMSVHNEGEGGAMAMMESELNDYGEYDIKWFRRDEMFSSLKGKIAFYFSVPYDMATSNYIFLNDNFMPMANLNFSPETKVIQLWHGEGVLKRSCLAMDLPANEAKRLKKCNSKLDALVVSSKGVVDVFSETFGIDKSKIYPLGTPRVDYYFKNDRESAKRELIEEFPECEGKKIVLYAPTFRDDKQENDALISHFPFEQFAELEDYVLLVRLHPQVKGNLKDGEGYINVNNYKSVSKLALAADILISDYSSIIMDFTVQSKPVVYYAFDLDTFENGVRGFHFDYETYVGGAVVKTPEELIEVFKSGDFKLERLPKFRDFNFDYRDKYSSKRVIEKLVN